jgi:Plasmid pRiA4b ORF-3-like protein
MIARASAGRRSSVPARLYLLYAQLAEIKPSIWRRLAVPGRYTLHALHGILQAAMPWQDYHLYQFEIGGTRYEDPNPDDRDPSVPDPQAFTLDQLALAQGSRFQYTYDFGDDWLHDITVEGVVPLPRDFMLPVCLGGARACPPEDCGGVSGYEELVAALRRPRSAAAQEYREWLGRVYDPEELDLAASNVRLGHRVPPSSRSRPSKPRRGAV